MKPTILVFCLLTFLPSSLVATDQEPPLPDGDVDDLIVARLPDNTEPVSYDLRIKPVVDPVNENYTFTGQVDIVIKVNQYTSEVTLNSKDLIVSSVSGFQDLKTERYTAVTGYVYDERNNRLVVSLARSILPPRLYRFTVRFEGILKNDFKGLHRYFYDSDNPRRWTVLTQFKPIYARRAFPCYDEPKFKTAYKIAVARQYQHFSLSNMPLKLSKKDPQMNGWVWDHFETTKPIPTYLVAFMVSDFDKKTLNNDNITIYTRKEFIEDTTYMRKKAPNLLKSVEKFTQISYMLPKLDLVGIPLVDAYNMENWGLNLYKESYLTLSNNSLIDDKILGTRTVLNAILHQWFGNMVTTPWWDSAWLNEGICNYLNYYITNTMESDWDLEDMFVENIHQHALAWDEYDDTHPLTSPVSTPDEIVDSFDPITLDKSAALFRMLECMVGAINFRTSLNKYLIDYAYIVAGPRELWSIFDYVLYDADYVIDDGVIVNNSMYLWTEQAGYPLINVMTGDDGSVVVSQNRFTLSYPNETDHTKWFVGLTYTTEKIGNFNDVTPTVWLKPEQDQKTISVPENSGWIIFNIQSTGFYRVNYDEKNWKLLLLQLITKPHKIHVLNRAQIIDDVYHLSRATLIPYSYYISLLEYLLMEDHVTPWSVATNGLSTIMDTIRQYPSEYLKFKEYAKNLAGILYTKLTNNRINNGSSKIVRRKLFTWTCKLGNAHCENSALKYFKAWTDGYNVPSEMEEAAFCVGMKKGNVAVWSKMLKLYTTTRKPVALRALACIENNNVLFNYLNDILNGVASSRNDKVAIFKTVCESITTTPQGISALVKFLSHKTDAILALPEGHRLVSLANSALVTKVMTGKEIATMRRISRSVESADLRAAFDEKLKIVESNTNWMKRDRRRIVDAIGKI